MNNKKIISLIIGGDFCPDNKVDSKKENDKLYCEINKKNIQHHFEGYDLSILNLECPLTHSNSKIRKLGPNLKGSPENIRILKNLDIKLLTLSNNHIRDYDDDGVKETISICRSNQIDTVGAGETLIEAKKIYYKNIKGRILAVINVSENEFAYANSRRAGANPLDLISLISDINVAKKKANHVILIIHGGLEYTHCPSPESIRLLRFLSEQGLTSVIRHHPHYFQGYEVWKGVPIFYSLGNFFFNSTNKALQGWFEGIIVSLNIDPQNRCSFEVHPFEQSKLNNEIHIMTGIKKKNFMEKFYKYSAMIQDPYKIEELWKINLDIVKQSYLGQLSFFNYFFLRVLRKFKFNKLLVPSSTKRLFIQNMLLCDSHREALIDILKSYNNH